MAFTGFTQGTVRFLSGLSTHNEKAWFDAHKSDYEASFIAPARELIEALAPRLKKIDPHLQAVPKVNGSIMRINRDVRFSKDKSPYKDHLDLWFWSGEERGWESSGFFFRLTAKKLLLGGGMHGFMPPFLERYRKAVLEPKRGEALSKIVVGLRKLGYEIGGESYKKPPRGVDSEHPRVSLLKHSGLHAGWKGKHPKELRTPELVSFVARHYAAVAPLHRWLTTIGG